MSNALEDAAPVAQRTRWDSNGQQLVGGRCSECGCQTWPRRTVCPKCGAFGPEEHPLPRTGQLLSWTRVFVPLASIEAPFILVQVRLDDSVTLFGHLRGDPESGLTRVETHVDESARPPFWFELVAGDPQ